MANVKGLSVSGDLIADAEDKTFFVCASPHYEQVPDLRNPGKTKEKLIVPVQLPDGSEMDYYPNKSSVKMMAVQYGIKDMDAWIGHKFEWAIADQNIAGQMKKVLFVAAKRFNEVLPKELK